MTLARVTSLGHATMFTINTAQQALVLDQKKKRSLWIFGTGKLFSVGPNASMVIVSANSGSSS